MLILIIIIVLLCGFKVKVNSGYFPLIGLKIIVDPGHGGKDPGTLYKDIYEKDIVLKISSYLEKELIRNGAMVLMTRYADYDLSSPNTSRRKKSDFDNRIKLINESQANYYLSIHLNFLAQTQYYGPQVFYTDKNIDLATIIQNEFNKHIESDRVIKKVPNDNYMYKKLVISGVLIECGFLSNSKERELLQQSDYQIKIAKIIANGLINYNNN